MSLWSVMFEDIHLLTQKKNNNYFGIFTSLTRSVHKTILETVLWVHYHIAGMQMWMRNSRWKSQLSISAVTLTDLFSHFFISHWLASANVMVNSSCMLMPPAVLHLTVHCCKRLHLWLSVAKKAHNCIIKFAPYGSTKTKWLGVL